MKRSELNEQDIFPTKRLGQNFLVDQNIIRKIVDSAEIEKRTVLEIGGGLGALTGLLAERAKFVFSVEKDKKIIPHLAKKMEGLENFELIEGDILKLDPCDLSKQKLKVVGNLPYSISTPILFWILDHIQSFSDATLMLQREVAERIVSRPNSKIYGSLSVAIQAFSEAKIMFQIPPTAFVPRPKVTSSIIKLKFHQQMGLDRGLFQRLVKTAFSQRRKMISNSLKSFGIEEGVLRDLKISPNIRAENLSVDDYIELAKHIQSRQR